MLFKVVYDPTVDDIFNLVNPPVGPIYSLDVIDSPGHDQITCHVHADKDFDLASIPGVINVEPIAHDTTMVISVPVEAVERLRTMTAQQLKEAGILVGKNLI